MRCRCLICTNRCPTEQPNTGPRSRTHRRIACRRSNRRPASCTQDCPHRGTGHGGSIGGVLRCGAKLLRGPFPASRIVVPELFEGLAMPRHHHHVRTGWQRRRTTGDHDQQDRKQRPDGMAGSLWAVAEQPWCHNLPDAWSRRWRLTDIRDVRNLLVGPQKVPAWAYRRLA